MGRRTEGVNVLSELKFDRAAATPTTTCLIYLGKSFPCLLYRYYRSTIIIIIITNGITTIIIVSYVGITSINGHTRGTRSPIGYLVNIFIRVDSAKATTFSPYAFVRLNTYSITT